MFQTLTFFAFSAYRVGIFRTGHHEYLVVFTLLTLPATLHVLSYCKPSDRTRSTHRISSPGTRPKFELSFLALLARRAVTVRSVVKCSMRTRRAYCVTWLTAACDHMETFVARGTWLTLKRLVHVVDYFELVNWTVKPLAFELKDTKQDLILIGFCVFPLRFHQVFIHSVAIYLKNSLCDILSLDDPSKKNVNTCKMWCTGQCQQWQQTPRTFTPSVCLCIEMFVNFKQQYLGLLWILIHWNTQRL